MGLSTKRLAAPVSSWKFVADELLILPLCSSLRQSQAPLRGPQESMGRRQCTKMML